MFLPTILKGKDVPKHLAIGISALSDFLEKPKKTNDEAKALLVQKLSEIIDVQTKKEIPVITISVNPGNESEQRLLREAINEISSSKIVSENKIRLFIIGDWYSQDTKLVDEIKRAMELTKDYDYYFLNFCISYDGKREILTAAKLLLKKARLEKISLDSVWEESMKENMPSSYFPSPELIIMNSTPYSGLLLWDSPGAYMYFSKRKFIDFERKDIDKAIDFFNEHKQQAQ